MINSGLSCFDFEPNLGFFLDYQIEGFLLLCVLWVNELKIEAVEYSRTNNFGDDLREGFADADSLPTQERHECQ